VCTQEASGTRMAFTRNVAADNGNQVAVTLGVAQPLIFASGASGVTALAYHGTRKGLKNVDLQSLSSSELRLPGEASLYAHMLFMLFSWGLLLPWGVAIANRTRTVKGAPKGAWFHVHKNMQYVGWFFQIIGFVCAIVYIEELQGVHFTMTPFKDGDGSNPHTYIGLVVVILGTLQPLNAFFRPHNPAPGEPKPTSRFLWEILHKGSGYSAIVLGAVNIVLGILLVQAKSYDNAVIGVSAAFAALGLIPVIIFVLVSFVNPQNCCSRMITKTACTPAADRSQSTKHAADIENNDQVTVNNPARQIST